MVQRKRTGEFSMPVSFLEFIASLAQPQPGNRLLDLSWRDDELLSAINRREQPNSLELWGVTSRREALESRYEVVESDLFLDVPQLARESFDIVVMNPPWGFRLPQSVLSRSEIGRHARPDSVSLYLEWATWYLKPGATLIASVPGAFLHNYSFKCVRDFLLSKLRLRGVFEFKPALVFDVPISIAVMCLERPRRADDYKPDCFMAEIDGLDDLRQVYDLYRLASNTTDNKLPFQLGFSRVGKSIVFTSEPAETFSPTHTYFARNILSKLNQFPTKALGEIADVQTGMAVQSRYLLSGKGRSSHRLLAAKNVRDDGTIAGPSFLREATTLAKTDRFQLRTGDILIRTVQSGSKLTGYLSQPETYSEGVIAAIVPREYEGSLYDHTLLRIRLTDQAPANITPKYIVQLFRNEFDISGFNHVVLDQIVSASTVGRTLARIVPSLLQDIRIPFLPSGLLEIPQIQEKGLEGLEQWGQRILEEQDRKFRQISQLITTEEAQTRAQIAELKDEIHRGLTKLQDSWRDRISQAATTQRDSLYEERARDMHSFIEREMRERGRVIDEFQKRFETYVFGDYWPLIDSDARLFLATGEFFYDFSKSMDLTPPDYSGIAVEFCKAVEIELWKRIGKHLGETLISRGIDKYPFWSIEKGKYQKNLCAIQGLAESKAMLGAFLGFTWGLVKHSTPAIEKKYRDAGARIQEVIAEISPQPNLLNEHGIPKLLSELTQHRNGSAHKDKLERQKLEELHSIVVSIRPEDSLIVQLIQAFPL